MKRIGKTKWILTKYKTWFGFFLVWFMNGYKWDERDLEKSFLIHYVNTHSYVNANDEIKTKRYKFSSVSYLDV